MAADPFDRPGPRLLAMLGLWVFAGLTYAATAICTIHLHPGPMRTLVPSLPLLPWSLIPYATLGLFTLAPVIICPAHAFRQLLRASLLAMAAAYAAFIILPTNIERGPVPGWWGPAYDRLRSADGPVNNCPSLHVAYVGLVLAARGWPWWMWLWGAVITASTLTTHQHVVVDVLGGIALTAASWWLAERFRPAGSTAV